jgi:hypothetical protein
MSSRRGKVEHERFLDEHLRFDLPFWDHCGKVFILLLLVSLATPPTIGQDLLRKRYLRLSVGPSYKNWWYIKEII